MKTGLNENGSEKMKGDFVPGNRRAPACGPGSMSCSRFPKTNYIRHRESRAGMPGHFCLLQDRQF